MILDRNQLVWFAVAEFSIAEIRKPFGENQKPTPSRFSAHLTVLQSRSPLTFL